VPDFINSSVINGTPTLAGLLLCTVCSLAFGLAVAGAYMYRNRYSNTMAVTLVILPAVVQVIIMLVNGNIGVGIAVAGAFSLIRFRSIPGNAREICCLFFGMAIGFVCGMGYLFYALMFLILIGGVCMLMARFGFGQGDERERTLRITIPESLDFDGLFDDLFEKYTSGAELERVRTTNMGSLYELTYTVRLKDKASPRAFLDELRCRNGNLSIMLGREKKDGWEL
jgi:hypothetical protein